MLSYKIREIETRKLYNLVHGELRNGSLDFLTIEADGKNIKVDDSSKYEIIYIDDRT